MTKAKPGSTYPPRGKTTVEERFWMKVDKSGECWLWTAGKNSSGYGTFNPDHHAAPVNAHRYAYELLVGPIPDAMEPDHLCRVRACVRAVEHMELLSKRDNILRAAGFAAINAIKTHCPQGHEYTPENTYIHRNMRSCKECRRIRGKAWRARH